MTVECATSADLDSILGWVSAEHEADKNIFGNTLYKIIQALELEKLWVIKEGDGVVAYQVGTYSPEILNVRTDMQNKGYGSELVAATFDRARQDDVNIITGECVPRSSFEFWKKHGFKRYGYRREQDPILIYRILSRSNTVPEGVPNTELDIEIFEESALRSLPSDPIKRDVISCARPSEDEFVFHERYIVTYLPQDSTEHIALRISHEGTVLLFDTAKNLSEFGVSRDGDWSGFYIDKLTLLGNRSAQ